VIKKKGVWVSADNRRLWIFKTLESLGRLDKITVKVTKYIYCIKGVVKRDVTIRGDPGGRIYRKLKVGNIVIF
jgi:hypothetical protein